MDLLRWSTYWFLHSDSYASIIRLLTASFDSGSDYMESCQQIKHLEKIEVFDFYLFHTASINICPFNTGKSAYFLINVSSLAVLWMRYSFNKTIPNFLSNCLGKCEDFLPLSLAWGTKQDVFGYVRAAGTRTCRPDASLRTQLSLSLTTNTKTKHKKQAMAKQYLFEFLVQWQKN